MLLSLKRTLYSVEFAEKRRISPLINDILRARISNEFPSNLHSKFLQALVRNDRRTNLPYTSPEIIIIIIYFANSASTYEKLPAFYVVRRNVSVHSLSAAITGSSDFTRNIMRKYQIGARKAHESAPKARWETRCSPNDALWNVSPGQTMFKDQGNDLPTGERADARRSIERE